jgi:hypothetical protein
MNLEHVLLRDTRANQPVATTVAEGTLYFVTDELVTEQSRSGSWVTYSGSVLDNLTFITESDETTDLPNSRQLLAGPGITLDDTTPGELTIEGTIVTEIIGITINGDPMTTGIKGSFFVPWNGTIIEAIILADDDGILEFDILKTDFATYPAGGTSIVASAPPELASTDKYQDSTLTGWDTDLAINDILEYELTVVDPAITRVTLFLVVELD